MENVKYIWARDEINKRPDENWLMIMNITRKFTLARIKKCATIMGRKEENDLVNYFIMSYIFVAVA
jgi:tyrosyl-tRNA synthetase